MLSKAFELAKLNVGQANILNQAVCLFGWFSPFSAALDSHSHHYSSSPASAVIQIVCQRIRLGYYHDRQGEALNHMSSIPNIYPRYFAEFCYRFNRRFDLQTIMLRILIAAANTAPMLGWLLKLAESNYLYIFFIDQDVIRFFNIL